MLINYNYYTAHNKGNNNNLKERDSMISDKKDLYLYLIVLYTYLRITFSKSIYFYN